MEDNMLLHDLSFARMPPTWEATTPIAMVWFPELPWDYDSRATVLKGRGLLSAFVLAARLLNAREANMRSIRSMIEREVEQPEVEFTRIDSLGSEQASSAVANARLARGYWFGDPLPLLSCTITDERVAVVSSAWQELGFARLQNDAA
jgi:hypothetical protein